jgi:hypothetical protein
MRNRPKEVKAGEWDDDFFHDNGISQYHPVYDAER